MSLRADAIGTTEVRTGIHTDVGELTWIFDGRDQDVILICDGITQTWSMDMQAIESVRAKTPHL